MALVTRDLSVARGARTLVAGLALRVAPGEITVVLGPNGCGKSTLLLALAGAHPLAGGSVELDGRPLDAWSHAERGARVAWQGELPSAEFGFTVDERLSLVRATRRSADEALARLDLAPLRARRLFELSAGERQRVELAALWLRDAPVWLLDEPTSHLDLCYQVACLRMLEDEARAGRALLVVLHDLTQAHAIADHALLFEPDGAHRLGPAEALLREDELARVYGTRVQQLGGPGGPALVPDYRAVAPSPGGPDDG